MHTNLHTIHIVRRMTASLTGALVALTVHAVYQDTTAVVASMFHDNVKHDAAPIEDTVTSDDAAAKVRAFAEQLKAGRAELSQ